MHFSCYNLCRHFVSFWFQLWLTSSKNEYQDSKKQRNLYCVNFLNILIFFNQPTACQTDTDKNKVQNPGTVIIYLTFVLSFMYEFHYLLLTLSNTTRLNPYNVIFLLLAFINIGGPLDWTVRLLRSNSYCLIRTAQ